MHLSRRLITFETIDWKEHILIWLEMKFRCLILWRMSLLRVETKAWNTFSNLSEFIPLLAIELVCQWRWLVPRTGSKIARRCFVEFIFDCINKCFGNLNLDFILFFHKCLKGMSAGIKFRNCLDFQLHIPWKFSASEGAPTLVPCSKFTLELFKFLRNVKSENVLESP